jgi:hypothetical protein
LSVPLYPAATPDSGVRGLDCASSIGKRFSWLKAEKD